MWLLGLASLAGCARSTATHAPGGVEVLTVTLHYNNTHLVQTRGGPILVDAGLEGDGPALAQALREAGIPPEELALIVVTHGHADHAGGASWLQARFGTPVLAGAADEELLAAGANDPLCPTDAIARRRLDAASSERFTPFVPDRVVGADPVDLADFGLEGVVTPIPGHTEGSLVLQVGDALFVGDLLRGSIASSAARTHFYQCDLPGNRADVADVLVRVAPDATHWFVGHFGPLERSAVTTWLKETHHAQ